MGQKINPVGFRLAVNRNWSSKWYANSRSLRADARRGHQGARLPQAQAGARLGRPRADRAPGEGRAHHHFLGAAGGGDRQEGRGDRSAQGRAAPHHGRAAGPREHRGNPQARDRRAADRRLDRAAAREAHHVPPRDEARDAERHAPGRAGHQDHERRAPERHRDRAHRVVPRGTRSAAYLARRYRLRNGRSQDQLRRHWHQGVGVQGRSDSQGRDGVAAGADHRADARARGAERAQAREEAVPEGRREARRARKAAR